MVSGRVAVAAVAAVVAVGSAAIMKPGSFDYYYPQASKNSLSVTERAHEAEKLCYEEGERAIGAKGYPAVPYLPCCSGKPPLPMDPSAKSYVEEEHYGLYCGGTGEVVPTEDCYKAGERSVGAPGKPFVDYKPCCDGKAPQDKYGDWGKFCGLPSPYAPEPVVPEEKIPTKCAGDDGYPYVPYVDCGDGYKCAREPKYGWGFFCLPTGKSCYGPGMKAQGAPGYPKIDYMPCCDGQEQVAMYGEWGKFCPGEKKPMYEAPKPDYYKPYGAPADYKPPTAPRGYEAYGATSAPSSTAPTSYGYYGGYSKKGPMTPYPSTTTVASTTTSPVVAAVQAILDDPEFACDSTAGGTATAGQPLPETVLSISEIDIQLPVCEAGEGLSQADANELLAAICAQAQLEDPGAVCTIVTVTDVVRMLVSDSESSLSPVARQGGVPRRVFIQIGWSTATPPPGFSVRIQGAFAGSRFTVVVNFPPVTTTVPPVTTTVTPVTVEPVETDEA